MNIWVGLLGIVGCGIAYGFSHDVRRWAVRKWDDRDRKRLVEQQQLKEMRRQAQAQINCEQQTYDSAPRTWDDTDYLQPDLRPEIGRHSGQYGALETRFEPTGLITGEAARDLDRWLNMPAAPEPEEMV